MLGYVDEACMNYRRDLRFADELAHLITRFEEYDCGQLHM